MPTCPVTGKQNQCQPGEPQRVASPGNGPPGPGWPRWPGGPSPDPPGRPIHLARPSPPAPASGPTISSARGETARPTVSGLSELVRLFAALRRTDVTYSAFGPTGDPNGWNM